MPTDLSIPPAPEPVPQQSWSGTPNVVLEAERYAIGWQRFPDEEGGPAYVTARRSILGFHKVLERYPLTADGWARAWMEFAQRAPGTAEKTRVALGRFYAERAPAGMLAFIPALILSAIDPPADRFAIGQAYDLRFADDGLQIARPGNPEVTAEYQYANMAAVQLTGFEQILIASWMRVFSNQGRMLPEFFENRTNLRVQTVDQILDFRYPGIFTPEYFRRWVEPVNLAIRQAWLSAAAAHEAERQTEWLVTDLSRLAERLDHGSLTRSDVELLKARIAGGY